MSMAGILHKTCMQVAADGGSPVSRSIAKNLVYEPRSMCALQPVGTHNAYEYLYG